MQARAVATRAAGPTIGGGLLILGLFVASRYSYVLFHTIVEMITIVVMVGVFVIAWNTRRTLDNNYLLVVGISAIFVAAVDLLHVLAYKGMGVFPYGGANLATQLWIIGRLIQTLALLAAPFFLGRRVEVRLVTAAFAAITVVLLLTLFRWHIFPAAYVEPTGLTMFKKVSEYAISLALLAATALLWWKRSAFDRTVLRLLSASLLLTVASEITFTFYLNVYGETNLAGHLLRLLASYALYKAVIETGLVRPHAILVRELKQSQEQLSAYATRLEFSNDELRRSEHQLRDHALILEQQNEELDAYAHTVAHDLKNPLAVIMANAELVSAVEGLPPEKVHTVLERIAATAEKMNRIVEALLFFSQVRREEAPVEVLDMGAIVARVRDGLRELITVSHARITVPDRWPPALGYPPWVEEVWTNYITNAIRHGGHPPEVELGADAAPDEMVRFWVRDNGPGIPRKVQERLFVPFRQFGTGAGRDAGHGLGLSIVLQIVQKLGGEVGVESEPGQGSRFFFTLPATTAREPTSTAAPW